MSAVRLNCSDLSLSVVLVRYRLASESASPSRSRYAATDRLSRPVPVMVRVPMTFPSASLGSLAAPAASAGVTLPFTDVILTFVAAASPRSVLSSVAQRTSSANRVLSRVEIAVESACILTTSSYRVCCAERVACSARAASRSSWASFAW